MITFKMFLENANIRRLDILAKEKYLTKAHQVLSKSVDPKDFTGNHIGALQHYTDDSKNINKQIRKAYNEGKHPSEVLSTKNDRTRIRLDHAITKTKPLNSSVHVYHGVSVDPRKDTHDKVWMNKNYTSTSLNPQHAAEFSGKAHGGHVIHFHLAKGSKHGIYADGLNRSQVTMDPEHEYILAHGQKWKHVGSEEVKHEHSSYTLHHMIPHKED